MRLTFLGVAYPHFVGLAREAMRVSSIKLFVLLSGLRHFCFIEEQVWFRLGLVANVFRICNRLLQEGQFLLGPLINNFEGYTGLNICDGGILFNDVFRFLLLWHHFYCLNFIFGNLDRLKSIARVLFEILHRH